MERNWPVVEDMEDRLCSGIEDRAKDPPIYGF